MNNEEIKKIAQWVIDNRYPKSEKEKVSDSEMYHNIVDKLSQPTQGDVTVEEVYKEFFGVSELFANGTTINKSVLRFAEAYATQYKPTQGEGVCTCKDGNIIKSDNGVYWCQTCGKYPVIMATQTPDELREEFERETNGLNWNLGGTWRFYAEWLEQKLTGKEDKVCPKVSQCTNVDVSCDCPDNVICPIIIE